MSTRQNYTGGPRDDEGLGQAASNLHIASPMLWRPIAPDLGISYPEIEIPAPNNVRYSPSPFFGSPRSTPSVSLAHEPEFYTPLHQHQPSNRLHTREYEPEPFDQAFHHETPRYTNQSQMEQTSVGQLDSQSYPMFSPEGPIDAYQQNHAFQRQTPQEYQPYMGERRQGDPLQREQWIGPKGQRYPESSSYGSQYGQVGWDTQSDFDDRCSVHSYMQERGAFASSQEMENPFLSGRGKARLDTKGGIRQLYRPENYSSFAKRIQHADTSGFVFPSKQRAETDTRFTPSVLPQRVEMETPASHSDKTQDDKDRTPTKSVKSDQQNLKIWEFVPRPSTMHGRPVHPEKGNGNDHQETKSVPEAELVKEPSFQTPEVVAALKTEAKRRIQEQFKAQVAKKLEESQRVIEPTFITNAAYDMMNKLGLLAHPALQLGLIHNKPDTRNIHEKFRVLIQSIRMEESYQMEMHLQLSEKLLLDLNLTEWNLLYAKKKQPTPIATPFEIMGVPMPEPYGDFVNKDGISLRHLEKHRPIPLRPKNAPLSSYPMTREIQLRTGEYYLRTRYARYGKNAPVSDNENTEGNPEERDFQFKVKPKHWQPPEDFQKNYPSAARWEEIAIIKTYHQALTVQQHLYLSFVNLGPTFFVDWVQLLIAKEREALLVRAFSLTMRMASDDSHEWVDKEWVELPEEEKQKRAEQVPETRNEALNFNLSDYREVDENNFPIPFSRDMFKGITININDSPPPPKDPPEKSMATYSLFCHELHPYYLARDPDLLETIFDQCLIMPNLTQFPRDSDTLGENYFWKPAMSIKEPRKVNLGGELERSLPFMPGLPLGPNVLERVKADKTFFYSAFLYNLLTVWRDFKDEKVWFYGNGTPHRYDPNKPPANLGQPKSKFPKGEKWMDGGEIEKHVAHLQQLIDILNLGVFVERWVPEDDAAEGKEPELESWFGGKRSTVNQRPPSPRMKEWKKYRNDEVDGSR
ncbi:uncharacterized protein DFL_007806 [Arthrobotrys flagrans]|uniref:Uncharacterized protein n=1 Tax=Arthrobotrys flagrans TaxID=97331 RepID=A0A436ZWT9_ARTFL|nr:hypothetical protein DFL_007806 [Arthrobotrys flagrans]